MKLVSIGESTLDYYPEIGRHFVGGISSNFAVQAKRCGAEHVSLVSLVGRDEQAQIIRQKLVEEGIDVTRLVAVDGKTAVCEIIVKEGGERYFPPNSYHQNVLADYRLTAADLSFVQRFDLLVSRFDIAYSHTYFDQLMIDLQFEGQRVGDFGDWFDYEGDFRKLENYIRYVDFAFISGDRATIEFVAPIAERLGNIVVVTLGSEGSVGLVGGKRYPQEAIPVEKIVDTTGCGDAFQAGFVVSYYKNRSIEQALAAGAENAAKVLQHFGAI